MENSIKPKKWEKEGALDMKNSIGVLSVSKFYHSAVKAELKKAWISKEYRKENNKDAQRNYEQGERNWQLKAREQLCNGKLFYCNEPQHR